MTNEEVPLFLRQNSLNNLEGYSRVINAIWRCLIGHACMIQSIEA